MNTQSLYVAAWYILLCFLCGVVISSSGDFEFIYYFSRLVKFEIIIRIYMVQHYEKYVEVWHNFTQFVHVWRKVVCWVFLMRYRAVLKDSVVLATSWWVEDVSHVSATTMLILVILTQENAVSVVLTLLVTVLHYHNHLFLVCLWGFAASNTFLHVCWNI